MSAILRIDARTSGQQGLKELDGLVRRIGPGAEGSVGGVSRLSQALGNMGTIAGGIGLANLGGRMIAFAGDAVQAGDDALLFRNRLDVVAGSAADVQKILDFASEAADRFSMSQVDAGKAVTDLYSRLEPVGLGYEDIKNTFNGIASASRLVGLSTESTNEVINQFAQAVGEGKFAGDEFKSILGRIPPLGKAIVDVFNDIARNKGLVQITRDRADQMIAEVKTGEKRQTEIMKEEAKERERAAESETDALLREIGKRYDAMRKALGDNYDDMADADSKARNERLDGEREAIDERFDAERKAYERRYQDVRERLSDDKTLNDEQKKSVERRLEDEREMILKEIQDRQDAELKGIEETAEKQAKVRQRDLRDRRQQEEEALQEGQRREEESRRGALERQKQDIQASLNEQIEANKKANEAVVMGILARVKVTQGQLKQMAADGLIPAEIVVKAFNKFADSKIPDATPLTEYNKAMKDLSTEVGDNLLPLLTPLIEGLAGLVNSFGALPEPVQSVGIGLVAVGVGAAGAVASLAVLIGSAKLLGTAFAGLKIAATIAGWAGAIGPFVGTFTAAMTGLLAWMTGTFVPAMVGIFSGPVGWIALGVAAVIAGMIFFREPIMEFFGWAYEQVVGFWKTVFGFIYDTQIKPWVELWNTVLAKPVTDAAKGWLTGITKFFSGILEFIDTNWLKQWASYWEQFTTDPFEFIEKVRRRFDDLVSSVVNTFKTIPALLGQVWDSTLSGMSRAWGWMTDGVTAKLNDILSLWNRIAEATNKLPTPFKLPIVPLFERQQIPGFARGGFIDKPTLGVIGEGRNPREYVIPEGGMGAAADGWRRGLRGDALVNAWQSPVLAPGRASMEPSGGGMGGQAVIPEVSIQVQQSGPTYRLPDGTDTISRAEAMALVAEASRLTLQAVVRANAGAAARSARRG
jgi:tape measure domain-containing protein